MMNPVAHSDDLGIDILTPGISMIYGAQPINAYTSVKWAEETMLHGAILATEDQNTLIEQSALH